MRWAWLVPAALLFAFPASLFAQGSDDPQTYVSKADYFSIDFPGQPKVEEIQYPDEYRITLPARVYTAVQGKNTYRVTVVDYNGAAKIHQARNAKCVHDAGADKPGLTAQQRRDLTGDACQDESVKDIRGAMMYAVWNIINKADKVTHLAYYNSDLIEGYEVHTNNPDATRTYAVAHMYENRLYIIEAIAPQKAPAANWFQISIKFLNEKYEPVRYTYSGLMIYSNGYPKPPLAGQNGQAAAAAQGAR